MNWNYVRKSMLEITVDFKFLSLRLKMSRYLLPKVSNTKAYWELSADVEQIIKIVISLINSILDVRLGSEYCVN